MNTLETLSVGKRCVLEYCGKIDYLPFDCHYCRKIYCGDHFKEHPCSHILRDNRCVKCMICSHPIAVPNGEDPNVRVNQHIQNNCKKVDSINDKICQFGNHKVSIITNCKDCHLSLCLKHRHGSDHKCEPRPAFKRRSFSKLKTCPVQ
eukprot:NODE_652_length_5520_cov_0.241284.p4 type:complete len:148 gc:universal NODE_652_length_5520_cov_0.241284:1730-2173(+)